MNNLIDAIKVAAQNNNTHIQSTEAANIEKIFNKLFYSQHNVDEETAFIKQVITRGTESIKRTGLHASAIIVGEKEFCMREQVLSLIYEQLQGDNISVGIKRIFEEGNSIHEKWQRLFIRGGLGKATDMDYSQFNDLYELSYTPDAIISINNEKWIVEIKSVNTRQFKSLTKHDSGLKQLRFYMRLTNIKNGIVLCEDKNNQDFKVFVYHYDEIAEDVTDNFIRRLNEIQWHKTRLIEEGKVPKRHPECTSYSSRRCLKCNMRDVCFGKSKVRL